MKAVAFVGPSVVGLDLSHFADIEISKPIRRGSLAAYRDYDLFLVIDGEFSQSLSVSPKELLALLDSSKTVIGAASMGALRASELDTNGMVGVGWVYERFARARVRKDDDVALCYSPYNFEPVTVPMCDLEYWFECLESVDRMSRTERLKLSRRLRNIFFADRTTPSVYRVVQSIIGPSRLEVCLSISGGQIPSIKSLDAIRAFRVASQRLRNM
jgi:hypothetical protein